MVRATSIIVLRTVSHTVDIIVRFRQDSVVRKLIPPSPTLGSVRKSMTVSVSNDTILTVSSSHWKGTVRMVGKGEFGRCNRGAKISEPIFALAGISTQTS